MNFSAADLYHLHPFASICIHLHPFASICTMWRSQVDLRLKWKNPKNLLRPYFIQFALLFIPETSGDNSSDIFEMFTVCGFIFLSLAGLGKQFLGTQRPEPEGESELGRWRQVILTCTWTLKPHTIASATWPQKSKLVKVYGCERVWTVVSLLWNQTWRTSMKIMVIPHSESHIYWCPPVKDGGCPTSTDSQRASSQLKSMLQDRSKKVESSLSTDLQWCQNALPYGNHVVMFIRVSSCSPFKWFLLQSLCTFSWFWACKRS